MRSVVCVFRVCLHTPMANSKLLRGGWHVCFYLCCRSKPFRLLPGDIAKLQFTLDAVNKPDPFTVESEIPTEVQRALEWISANDPEQIRQEREIIMQKIEARARRLWFVYVLCRSLLCYELVFCSAAPSGLAVNARSGWLLRVQPHVNLRQMSMVRSCKN